MRPLSRFAFICLVFLPVAATACGASSSPPAAATRGGRAPASQRQATPIAAGTCLDGTSSSASAYAIQMRGMLADAVAGWVPPPSAHPAGAASALPQLHFVLRSVTSTSFSTDDSTLDASIAGVAGLAPQPSPLNNPSFASEINHWTTAKTTWQQDAAAASRGAAALAVQVRQFHIVRGTWSGIYSCIAAAAAQLAPADGPSTRLAVISDLENNRPVAGLNLAGDAVLLVTICPAQVATTCPQRFAAARSFLLRHGASAVTAIRADAVTAATFDHFWGQG